MTKKINLDLPWYKSDFLVLDLEGTGSQHKDREAIIEIAAIDIVDKQLTDHSFYKLINPEIEIPSMISRINGLKNSELVDKPIFSAVKETLSKFIDGKILIGHNVRVDYNLLKKKIPSYNPPLILDTLKLSRHFWADEKKHNLDALIDRFNLHNTPIPENRGRHGAFFDAYITGVVFLKILENKVSPSATLKEILPFSRILPPSSSSQGTLF